MRLALLVVLWLAVGCRDDVVLAERDGGRDGSIRIEAGSDGSSGEGGTVTCGEPCDPVECGPAPGFEARCEDGVTSSSASDRCLRTAEGGCAWEIIRCVEQRTCPDESLCGPALGAPAFECPDGTIGGNTGRCLLTAEGGCAWQLRDCPGDPCAETACGPAPGLPNVLCDDHVNSSGPTGRCLTTADGSCAWEIVECPFHEPFCT